MKQIALISFCCIMTLNCFCQKTIQGLYKENVDVYNSILRLNADSTYEYLLRGDIICKYSLGKWKAFGTKIILNSDIQSMRKVNLEIQLQFFPNDTNTVIINIIDYFGLPVDIKAAEFNGKYKRWREFLTRSDSGYNLTINSDTIKYIDLFVNGFDTLPRINTNGLRWNHLSIKAPVPKWFTTSYIKYYNYELVVQNGQLIHDPYIFTRVNRKVNTYKQFLIKYLYPYIQY